MAVDKQLLEETLDIIRQSLQADGGDVELIDVDDDGVVTLELQGACAFIRSSDRPFPAGKKGKELLCSSTKSSSRSTRSPSRSGL